MSCDVNRKHGIWVYISMVMTISSHLRPFFNHLKNILIQNFWSLFGFCHLRCTQHVNCASVRRAEKDDVAGTPAGMVLARRVLWTDNGRYTTAGTRNTAGIARENDRLRTDVGSSIGRWTTYSQYLPFFTSCFFVLFYAFAGDQVVLAVKQLLLCHKLVIVPINLLIDKCDLIDCFLL